jgi:5'-nucleotidase
VRILSLLIWLCGVARADWLTLLDTTDRHGHVEAKDGRGGAAMLGGYLANARKAGPVVLVDSGDLFQGTMVSNLGEGQAVVRAMNALGYQASALGNHEFDFGPVGPHAVPKEPKEDPLGALRARAAEAKFVLLSANIVGEKVPWKKWTLVTAGGVKVGMVGGTSEDLFRTTIKPNLVGLKVEPLAPAIIAAATEARKAGAAIVVVMVHAGEHELLDLARELQKTKLVNALFGGHTHKTLNTVVDGLPVAQPLAGALELAEIDLEIENGKATGKFRLEPNTPIREHAEYKGAPVTADEKVAASFAEDVARAAQKRAAAIGVSLEGGIPRAFTRESPLGNLVADLMRVAGHADIGLTNGGGLRADLPPGPLTYGALFEALPFDNRLATLQMKGSALRNMLMRNLQHDHGIFSVSGAHLSAHCTEKGLTVDIEIGGKPIDDGHLYRVATSDFLALGGDDFDTGSVKELKIDEDLVLRDLVAGELAHMAKGGVLSGSDPRFWDPSHRRIDSPPRPVKCH